MKFVWLLVYIGSESKAGDIGVHTLRYFAIKRCSMVLGCAISPDRVTTTHLSALISRGKLGLDVRSVIFEYSR